MADVDEETRKEEERLNRVLSQKTSRAAAKPFTASQGVAAQGAVMDEVKQPPKLKPTVTVDKAKPHIENTPVRQNNHGAVFGEIKAEERPKLKPVQTVDKSVPAIEKGTVVKKSERPNLMADIKEAGGTQGLQAHTENPGGVTRAGSVAAKNKQFEQAIVDHNKGQEKPQKKTVWAQKGTNQYSKKTVYAKPEGGPPPKKTLAELL